MAIITEATTSEAATRFRLLFEEQQLHENGSRQEALLLIRQKAIERLAEMRFPTRRDEDWKYTGVAPIVNHPWHIGRRVSLLEKAIREADFSGLHAIRLVFANGLFQPQHSTPSDKWPDGLHITPVGSALEQEPSAQWLWSVLEANAAHENPFVVLNTALAKNGFYITTDPGKVIDQPVNLMMFSTDDQPFIQCPQVFVHAGQDSELSVVERYLPKEGNEEENAPHFTCAMTRLRLEANARVHHYRLQQEHHSAFQVNYCEAEQARDSVYSSYAVDLGGSIIRNNQQVTLQDSNTETHLNGVYLLSGVQHVDNQTFIDHAVPHCQSNELYKGIVSEKAKGVFNGKVLVRPDAQKTNAFQQNSTLLLSPAAVMDTKPQLEIFADDVRCSHGATVGQLDDTAVFYLRSRGLSAAQSRSLLQYAFLAEVLDNLPYTAIREQIAYLVQEKLNLQT